ncbi:recombinase family protein [Nitrobacter vulgaris]|uniref:recombinase family protein n=1 Tax=Nitrobacter vulgaris TaxID=29421 RepID=UPI00286A9313|nr:recombinase family protein [Nitrobacter vulgaris]
MRAGKAVSRELVRCAIYTRVSTENGLDQEFNSLDAQFEASSAYIKSQAHAGWVQVKTRYDDGGFSGGSTDRPALQNLLEDIRARKIDVILVYKVDRLTRSLADFAKLVELFDAHRVSFVSVTQQFNTTTSMGRLTLNVLLSFAQFEREVTSERIRDKVAASKKKGIWVGGPLPLGYVMENGKVAVVPEEAERVRHIFTRYLELGSVRALMRDLKDRDIVSRRRVLKTGAIRGGVPFGCGALFHLLRNRFYVGEVNYKGQICPGEQQPILDRDMFDQVQTMLTDQRSHQTRTRTSFSHLLTGLMFDDAGHRMAPTQAQKKGRHYSYYVSRPLLFGNAATAAVGSVSRVPAPDIDDRVRKVVLEPRNKSTSPIDNTYASLLIERIEVQQNRLVVQLKQDPDITIEEDHSNIVIPWTKPPSKRARSILRPTSAKLPLRPIKLERRATLVAAIARGRRWLDELITDSATDAQAIAKRERCSLRHVNMTLSLAFLSPALAKAAVEGRLPRGIGLEQLRKLPLEWDRQFEALALGPM